MHYQLLLPARSLLSTLIPEIAARNGVSKVPIVHLNCRDRIQTVTIFAKTSFKGTQVTIINSQFPPFVPTDLDEEKITET